MGRVAVGESRQLGIAHSISGPSMLTESSVGSLVQHEVLGLHDDEDQEEWQEEKR